jgi:hypothetical protein
MHELILIEIIAVPAERSRGRHNPRVVKRKMSRFPTKARAAPAPSQAFRYAAHIQIVAPTGSPADRVPPLTTRPKRGPKRRASRKVTAPADRLLWLEHVRAWHTSGLGRAAYCERHGLNPRAFHRWVARARPIFRKRGSRSGYSLSQRYWL